MNHLLDTHTFLWFINGEDELPVHLKKLIEDNNSNNYISIASLWEIAIKVSTGKLILKVPLSEIPAQINKNGFEILPVVYNDILIVSTLPFHHKDLFDRIIIAQGNSNNLKIISRDKHFRAYDVVTIW